MKIKALSEKTGLSNHTLRYYEKVGLIQDVKRGAGGVRDYSERDVDWINFLKCMKKTGMPIEELKIYADSFYSDNPDVTERIKVLSNHKDRLEDEIKRLQEASSYVDHKIAYYENFEKEQLSKSS